MISFPLIDAMDRFSQGLPDPADAKVMARCKACDAEIYEGEFVYRIEGDIICRDGGCLAEYIAPDCMTIEQALGME